jgi:hypothetical protein
MAGGISAKESENLAGGMSARQHVCLSCFVDIRSLLTLLGLFRMSARRHVCLACLVDIRSLLTLLGLFRMSRVSIPWG